MSGRSNARPALVILGALCAGLAAHAGSAADNEPAYRDIDFTATEGTWMSLDVSPDGKTIAFDLLNDIYVMPAAGGAATSIHSGPAVQRSPQFSPDGKSLVYLSDETGADNIWISALDGSGARQISKENLAMITGPAWSHDGRSIVAIKTNASTHDMKKSEVRRFFLDGAAEQVVVTRPESGKDVQEPRPRLRRSLSLLHRAQRRRALRCMNTGLSNFVIRRLDMQTGESLDSDCWLR